MIESAKEYKDISLKIVNSIIVGNTVMLEELLVKRQTILESEKDAVKFKKELIDNDILEIDKKIHYLLNEKICSVKREIREHRLSKQANSSYMNFSREKLNIFNKKV